MIQRIINEGYYEFEGSIDNFKKCSRIAYNSKSKKVKDEERQISDVWDEYMFSLKKYSEYSEDEIIRMCDNLSKLYKDFIDKYGTKEG